MGTENTKRCTKCETVLPATFEYFSKQGRNSDNLQTYCRACNRKMSSKSQGLKANKIWAIEGYDNSQEHFNEALKHYADIFDCPALLKHQDTGSWHQTGKHIQ